MEERQRLEIGDRIRTLRERSRWTQPRLANKLGLSLSGYQKLEQRGTTKWERVEQIAEIHEVDPNWIWEGTERGKTPNLLAQLETSDAESLSERLAEALEILHSIQAALAAVDLGRRQGQDDERSGEDRPEVRGQ
jgi:transcriptional regulator with XRE-family HTH domain